MVIDVNQIEGESVASLNSLSGGVTKAFQLPSFQNPGNRFDVDADGMITPRDALAVINHLNRGTDLIATDLAGAIGVSPSRWVDVIGDGKVWPLDALNVINELNRRSRADRVSAPEGEFGEIGVVAPLSEPGLEKSTEEKERLVDAVYAGLAQDSAEPLAVDSEEQVASLIVPEVTGDAEEDESSRAPDESVTYTLKADLPWLD